jgi:hypothetical protein
MKGVIANGVSSRKDAPENARMFPHIVTNAKKGGLGLCFFELL